MATRKSAPKPTLAQRAKQMFSDLSEPRGGTTAKKKAARKNRIGVGKGILARNRQATISRKLREAGVEP